MASSTSPGNAIDDLQRPSPLELADAWIRRYYTTQERLKIVRLSGEQLDMNQCYINLVVVISAGPHVSWLFPPSLQSLEARLQIQTPNEKFQMELPDLFNSRQEMYHPISKEPRRILIRGCAGVGKTTLCKKIVHEFLHTGMWAGLFERVLWLPLRRLKGMLYTQDNWKNLFYHVFFFDHARGGELSASLEQTLSSQRTLFLLDGLDEVSQEFTRGSKISIFLCELLNQPNVIITSRPGTTVPANVIALDLELEAIGFYPDQVKAYLENAVQDEEKVDEIGSFLESHGLIQDLVRIPIQLDAICFTWECFAHETMEQTMTGLYKAIEGSLLKKSLLQFAQKEEGAVLTESQISDCNWSKIEDRMELEIEILEIFAFTGLFNNITEFTYRHQRTILTAFKEIAPLGKMLPRLFFIRNSDPYSTQTAQSYHFLHLTFQEFFAARYFVRHWEAQAQLNCLSLESGRRNKITPTGFLAQHKYTAHHDVFWRFVTGLLSSEESTTRFFGEVENLPRDLLGPTHQRLLMGCLSEANHVSDSIRNHLESDMLGWLKFELKRQNSSTLVRHTGLPDQLLVRVWDEGSTEERGKILWAMEGRPRISSDVIGPAFSWLTGTESGDLGASWFMKDVVYEILRNRQQILSDEILRMLVEQLRDVTLRNEAYIILSRQPSLPDEISDTLVSWLDDQDEFVREALTRALGGQPSLSADSLQALVAQLDDQDESVRSKTAECLGKQSSLSTEILQALAARLDDQDDSVKRAAARALERQSNLPTNIFQALAARLEDRDAWVRCIVAGALGNRHLHLPTEILQALAARLRDRDHFVRWATTQALKCQTSLPTEILQALVERFEDQDDNIKWTAVQALGNQSNLPTEILQALAARLHDIDDCVKWASAVAIGHRHSHLSTEILRTLVSLLGDKDETIREAAAYSLGRQSSLPANLVDIIKSFIRQGKVDQAEQALRNHNADYSTLLSGKTVKNMYKILLDRSFKDHLSWYITDGRSCVSGPEGLRTAPIDGEMDEFLAMIHEARLPEYPTPNDLDIYAQHLP